MRPASGLVAAVALAVAATAAPCDAASIHDWPMYGHDIRRSHFNPVETRIHRSSAPFLRPKWVFHTGNAVTASPVVVHLDDSDNDPANGLTPKKVVYVGSADESFYAVDAADGKELWRFQADPAPGIAYNMFVSSAFVDQGRGVLYVGGGFTMYALNLYEGPANDATRVRWRWSTAARGGGEIESSPVMIADPDTGRGTVYFGSDLDGVIEGASPHYPALFAVDADAGELRWYWRPSVIANCGDVWCSVAVDPEEGLLYFDTSDCGRSHQGLYNEAIIALSIEPAGALAADLRRTDGPDWYYQPRDLDPYDYDFGSTPLLFDRAGKKYLGVGGKDGFYYAVERQLAATPGHFRDATWKTRVVRGGFGAGFIGSTAVDDSGRIFGATALFDTPPSPNPQVQPPYLHAFDAVTGAILWQQVASGPTFAATTAVRGVVFIGSTDGTFMALDAETGQVLWAVPAIGAVSSGAAVSDGEVFVGGGTAAVSYGFGQGPINALHAFALAPDAPSSPDPDMPPKLPPATWPLGVVEYPYPPDGTTPPPTPTP